MATNVRESWDGERDYLFDGVWYPSVTTILGVWPKPFLAPWAAKETAIRAVTELAELNRRAAEDPDEAMKWLKGARHVKSERGKNIGNVVHARAEAMTLGISAPVTEEVAPFVPQLQAWHEEYRPRPLYVEQRVFNLTVGYGGRFDLIADVYGRTLLIDYKTTKLGAKVVWDHHDWRLQECAYGHGEFIVDDQGVVRPMPPIDGYAVLHIPNDAPQHMRFIEMHIGDDEWRTFRAAAALYGYVKSTKKEPMGQLLLPQIQGELT